LLDNETREAYKNIRLQRDLRDEILARHGKAHRSSPPGWMRPAAALASAAVVIGLGAAVLRTPGHGILLDGDPLTKRERTVTAQTVEYAGGMMRMALASPGETPLQTAEGCAALEINYGRDVFITVSGGILLLPDADGVPTFAGQSGPAPDGAVIYWSPAGCEESSPLHAQLCGTEGEPLATLTLIYDAEDAQWRIFAD